MHKILLLIDQHKTALHDYLFEHRGIKNLYDRLDFHNKALIFYESEGKALADLDMAVFFALETGLTPNVIRLTQGLLQLFSNEITVLKTADGYTVYLTDAREAVTAALEIIKTFLDDVHAKIIPELIKELNSISIIELKNIQSYIEYRISVQRNSYYGEPILDKIELNPNIIAFVGRCIHLIRSTIYDRLDFVKYGVQRKTYDDIYNTKSASSFFGGEEEGAPTSQIIDDMINASSGIIGYIPVLPLIIAHDRTKIMFTEISAVLRIRKQNAMVIGGSYHLYNCVFSAEMRGKNDYKTTPITLYDMLLENNNFDHYPITLNPCSSQLKNNFLALCNESPPHSYPKEEIDDLFDRVNKLLNNVISAEEEKIFRSHLEVSRRLFKEKMDIGRDNERKERSLLLRLDLEKACLNEKTISAIAPYVSDIEKFIMEVNNKLRLVGHFVRDPGSSDPLANVYVFVRDGLLPGNSAKYYMKAPTEKKYISSVNCISIMMTIEPNNTGISELMEIFKLHAMARNQAMIEYGDQLDLINFSRMDIYDQIISYIRIGDTLSIKDFEDENNYKIKTYMERITDRAALDKELIECVDNKLKLHKGGGQLSYFYKYQKYKKRYISLKTMAS